jgi:hypothetical protein
MQKISHILLTTSLIIFNINWPVFAEIGECKYYCEKPIELSTGKQVSIEIINLTANLVEVEKVTDTAQLIMSPGEMRHFVSSFKNMNTNPFIFADVSQLPLKIKVIQLNETTLRIELYPSYKSSGDRSVYIKNNGRVTVY